MPSFRGGIFVCGGLVDEWAFNYIPWQPRKLILFGCYKDYWYCEPETKECIDAVDTIILNMIKSGIDKKPR